MIIQADDHYFAADRSIVGGSLLDMVTLDCMQDLFETQVVKTPNSVALVCDELQLTYRELDQRSNQLAHHLRRLGVTTEALVGICLPRSVDMVVAMLAILKAGGADHLACSQQGAGVENPSRIGCRLRG